jgi:hypothetical protein
VGGGEGGTGGGGIQKDDSKRVSVGAENRNPCKFLYTGTRFQTFSKLTFHFNHLPSSPFSCTQTTKQSRINFSSNIRHF